ncbi:MAG: OmpA family protein [Pseudoxanthomonas sp.]
MPTRITLSCTLSLLMLAACSDRTAPPTGVDDALTRDASSSEAAQSNDTAPDFPSIPQIVVPDIIGVTPAQRALESAMQDILDPIAGITVRPANCTTDGALVNDAGITSVDERGNVSRNGDEGIFRINADGSGTANYEGGIISLNADGSGTINGNPEGGGDDAIIRVNADGSGTYNGRYGIISLDGKGAGTWNGDSGLITNNGDGSGTWNGPQGLVTINADGSGVWNGPQRMVNNQGDGTGRVGTPGKVVKMDPLPKVPPAGKFPPLGKFAPPGAPCGFVITLSDRVLFDFDKSAIRPDASKVLDVLATALKSVPATSMEIRGHTDAKGSEDYNQALSERRAKSVVTALQARDAAKDANARGYGESQPVAPNTFNGADNPGGRQLNRRVEIFVRT